MEILVVNCNTSVEMTETIAVAARAVARPATSIIGATPTWGVTSAEGFYDSYLTAAAVLELLTTYPPGYDAVIMAGFGEHGREGARQLLSVPVIDITEAAAMTACLLGQAFGIVTTTRATVLQIKQSVSTMGLSGRCVDVVSSDLRVLGLHSDWDDTVGRFVAKGQQLIDAGADTIVLGCAGMAGLGDRVSAELGVPVIDGVVAAVGLAEALVHQNLRTSKVGAFTAPDLSKTTPRPMISSIGAGSVRY